MILQLSSKPSKQYTIKSIESPMSPIVKQEFSTGSFFDPNA